ncbi:MAG TPA: ABC transporter ATP-binding protein [Candidatus Udaeobacter sp.]|jgi:putative ABC transport system ATP-binding protein/lipoprotein-releasing system ATP-binding protein
MRCSCFRIVITADKPDKPSSMEATTAQLVAHDLFQSFRIGARRIEVLRGISVEVMRNEAVFLSGASGAGKTTLLYTLAGLERPESGTVEFEGRNLYNGTSASQARFRNQKMGFIFQGYFLLPELTALENVFLPGMIGGKSVRERAAEALTAVGLAGRFHHLPAELSGGEQQRVAIARALTNNPEIIFADEPTGNLDSKTGDAIMDLLLDLARSRTMTLLVVTHDLRLAARGDRQLHIKDGRLQ